MSGPSPVTATLSVTSKSLVGLGTATKSGVSSRIVISAYCGLVAQGSSQQKSIADLVIVEHGGSVAGAYCGKLFADAGAAVVVIGDDQLNAHQRRYLQRAKQRGDQAAADAATPDVVIESSAPSPLAPRTVGADVVHVTISPWGTHGPRAKWGGTDITDYAASGHLHLYGDPSREPLLGPAHQPAYAAGLFGFVGAMAALFARRKGSGGQRVDVSHVQVMAALHQFTLIRHEMTGSTLCRVGNRYTGPGQPNGIYPTADGWISIACVSHQQVESLLAVTDLLHLLDHPDIDSPMDFMSHPALLDTPLSAWLADKQVAETVELFQTMRIPSGPVSGMLDLLTDPQLIDRGFLETDTDGIKMPGRPYRIAHEQTMSGTATKDRATKVRTDGNSGPLSGLRVLDLTRVWAGPLATRILAELGADVVWVEAPWARGPREIPESLIQTTRYYPNDEPGERPWNRNLHYIKYALGKRSLAIDLNEAPGRAALEALIPDFDVVIENFSPRVMPQFGLGEDRLHELNPAILYVTMPGFGRSGPAKDWVAYGSSVDSHAGLTSIIGYREQSPWKGGIAWPDPIAGLTAVSAMLLRLWNTSDLGPVEVDSARQTDRDPGERMGGATIELAQFESTIAALGDQLIQAQVDGEIVPDGNRDPRWLAQGVYPCADDAWIAMSVIDDRSWRSLAELAGFEGELVADHDAFDQRVAAWTAGQNAITLAEELQAAGLVASPSLEASGVLADEHLAARRAFVKIDQPEVGEFTTPVMPIALSKTPVRVRVPAPTLGQHNREVLLAGGLSAAEVDDLEASGVIADEPPS